MHNSLDNIPTLLDQLPLLQSWSEAVVETMDEVDELIKSIPGGYVCDCSLVGGTEHLFQ